MTIQYVDATESKAIIDAIRNAIGRTVLFYTDTPTDCPVCSIDPVTNTSTNPYCTTCSGEGWIHHFNSVPIIGHITWAPSETLGWQSAGTFSTGDCRVQIEYTASNMATLDTTEYAIIDGRKFEVANKMYRGTPIINRILLDCVEFD